MRRKITKHLLSGLLVAAAVALWQLVRGHHVDILDKVLETLGGVALVLVTAFARWRERKRAPNQTLGPSLTRGLFGGLVGGAIGGLVFVAVYRASDPVAVTWLASAQIFVFAAFAGLAIGLGVQAAMWLGFHSGQRVVRALHEAGALLGGASAGAGVGALAAIYFVPKPLPIAGAWPIAVAGAVGAMVISSAIMLYEYDGRLRLFRAGAVVFVLVTALCFGAMACFLFLEPDTVTSIGIMTIADPNPAKGGAIWGALAGALLGLQVGLTLFCIRMIRLAADRARPAAD